MKSRSPQAEEGMLSQSGFDGKGTASFAPPTSQFKASSSSSEEERGEKMEFTAGYTDGELAGDIVRPYINGAKNLIGGMAGEIDGADITSTTKSGPSFPNDGTFDWRVSLETTGRSGWIVQAVEAEARVQDANGNDVHPVFPKRLWEAWAVDSKGKVTPGINGYNDRWAHDKMGKTEGHWVITSKCYFIKTDPKKLGFKVGGAKPSHDLLSTLTEPKGLGTAKLYRYAQGGWDTTIPQPYNDGSAGP
ncbi:MAG TPA: hypothetical protein ENJ82_09660 [Bacteroidetes bacterium]|nr:hypothetical protein [Bacteroidota bacterium]